MNNPIKKGMVIRHHEHLYFVEDVREHHSGQMKPTVHAHLRDIRAGNHVDRTLEQLLPLEPVEHTQRTLQYSYHRGDTFVFMDTQSFEECELSEAQLGTFRPFLREGQEVRAMFAGEHVVTLQPPEIVVLRVERTAAPERSVGTSNNILKEAVLDNGLTVRVPLFIKAGDQVRVDTRDH